MSVLVDGGCGGVGAAVGGSGGDAWLGLLDMPARWLLGSMVASALAAESWSARTLEYEHFSTGARGSGSGGAES
jgi:hypothetical protein